MRQATGETGGDDDGDCTSDQQAFNESPAGLGTRQEVAMPRHRKLEEDTSTTPFYSLLLLFFLLLFVFFANSATVGSWIRARRCTHTRESTRKVK